MSASRGAGDRVGSAADEAVKLFSALAEQARDHLADTSGTGTGTGSVDGAGRGGAGHAAECRWCPLCQAIAFVRGTDPELRGQVVSAGTALALALRDLAESAARPPRPQGPKEDGEAGPHTDVEDAADGDTDGRSTAWD